jgi:hypothetical protein
MGGAATVCIQYSDGSRDSYAAYNRGMAIIANHSSILNAKTDEECDAAARRLFQQEDENYRGSYFEVHSGLAPNWYGLVFIDIQNKRVVDCNGYTHVRIYLTVDEGYADDYAENVLRLAELGYVFKFSRGEEYLFGEGNYLHYKFDDMEKATVEDIQEAIDTGFRCDYSFAVVPPGWEYVCPVEDYYVLREYFKEQGYELSEEEEKKWDEFLAERYDDE